MEFLQSITKELLGNYVYIFAALFIGTFIFYKLSEKKKKFPPGPMGIPLLGYIPFLGQEPHKHFVKLAKKYGDIFSVNLGRTFTVIFNEEKSMKMVLSHQSALDRPPDFFNHIPEKGFFSTSGKEWNEQRRFSMQAVKDLGLGKSNWEKDIEEEITDLIEELRSFRGKGVFVKEMFARITSVIMLSLLTGKRLDKVKEKEKIDMLTQYMHLSMVNSGLSNPVTMFPALRSVLEYFKISGYHIVAETIQSFSNLIRVEILKRKNDPEYKVAVDFLTLYLNKLNEVQTRKESSYFSEYNLRGTVNVLFLGGSDTVAMSLEYLLRYMAGHNDVQSRVHAELDDVIGRDGKISYSEKHKLPYTMAVLMESQRLSCLVPLNLLRCTNADIEVNEYTIPKGSHVVANFYAIHKDPKYWPEPELFKPERFLDIDGKSVVKQTFSFTPFSTGRRSCPGESVAWKELLLFFTAIMQKFCIKSPNGLETSFEVYNGVVAHLKPQPICFIER